MLRIIKDGKLYDGGGGGGWERGAGEIADEEDYRIATSISICYNYDKELKFQHKKHRYDRPNPVEHRLHHGNGIYSYSRQDPVVITWFRGPLSGVVLTHG